MATAVVTGSSKGIGKDIALRLLQLGYNVVGISKSKSDIKHIKFHELLCDLTNKEQTARAISSLAKEDEITLLFNIAGFGVFRPHEEIKPEIIYSMVALNLSAPMVLTVRKSGVGVINIQPDITQTSFFDNLSFCPAKAHDTKLYAKDITDIVEDILRLREGVVVTDITIRAQKFAIIKKPL